MINYLSGGSIFNPKDKGLGVPFELSMALHSDAGASKEDKIIGTLGIYTTDFNNGVLGAGTDRYASLRPFRHSAYPTPAGYPFQLCHRLDSSQHVEP